MKPDDENEALRADLRNMIRERIRLWLKDSMSLYEMTDIPRLHAVEDILYVLLSFTLHGVDALGLDPKLTANLVEDILNRTRKAREARKATKEEST
jgi:hypothetical protein